jgi:Zn-dependent metalloprotease
MRIQCILPPYMLEAIAANGSKQQRLWAQRTLDSSAQFRGERRAIGQLLALAAVPAGEKRRTVYDAANGRTLPGKLVRGEGDRPTKDVSVNEAYDGAGATYDFYQSAFRRNSIDDKGMRLDSTVHYGQKYDNAMWNGRQMVYGDGDGKFFNRFTSSLDVIDHELTHGVTQHTAALDYQDQPGALNEHFSDVFGVLVKQFKLRQDALRADWLIGAGLLTSAVHGVALRSLKAPGTAYDDKVLGKDPQPADMRHFVKTDSDNGGVHINSGIPNRAFFLVASALGGFAWEKAGRIWYTVLTARLQSSASFADCARATWTVAGELFGSGKREQAAVADAWKTVGIAIARTSRGASTRQPPVRIAAARGRRVAAARRPRRTRARSGETSS